MEKPERTFRPTWYLGIQPVETPCQYKDTLSSELLTMKTENKNKIKTTTCVERMT